MSSLSLLVTELQVHRSLVFTPLSYLSLSSHWPARRGGNIQRSARCVVYTCSLSFFSPHFSDGSYHAGRGKVPCSPKILSRTVNGFWYVPSLSVPSFCTPWEKAGIRMTRVSSGHPLCLFRMFTGKE